MTARSVASVQRITRSIRQIRGVRVILDDEIAAYYGVPTGHLVRAVKRNASRFPADFAFQLTAEEFENLKCQTGISSSWGGRRRAPYAFTEHGVAMLSTVLRSARAVQVSIEIVRAFVRLREMAKTNAELARKIDELEKRYDDQFRVVFVAIRELMEPQRQSPRRIGFEASDPSSKRPG